MGCISRSWFWFEYGTWPLCKKQQEWTQSTNSWFAKCTIKCKANICGARGGDYGKLMDISIVTYSYHPPHTYDTYNQWWRYTWKLQCQRSWLSAVQMGLSCRRDLGLSKNGKAEANKILVYRHLAYSNYPWGGYILHLQSNQSKIIASLIITSWCSKKLSSCPME